MLKILVQFLLAFQQLTHEVTDMRNTIKHLTFKLLVVHVKNERGLWNNFEAVRSLALLQQQLFSTTDFEVTQNRAWDSFKICELELLYLSHYLSLNLAWNDKEYSLRFIALAIKILILAWIHFFEVVVNWLNFLRHQVLENRKVPHHNYGLVHLAFETVAYYFYVVCSG